MTVQFILPEATSFPKERKLHDRLFLVLLYNLLCKTFKDHSSTFAASLRSERNSLLQERCFPIASAKVGHFCIPCKTSTKKKCEKISFAPILSLHSIAKSVVKPIFSPLPHPTFFAPKSPFFPLFPFRTRFRAIFRGIVLVFSRSTVYFLSHSPILNPISSDFSMARHSFQPRTSIFPRFVQYFPILRTLLREISPFIFPALLFSHSVNTFPIRVFPFFILYPTFLFPLISFRPSFTPPSSLPPPLSFSFLPTFPTLSPINARTRTLSRNTRVRSQLPARQEVFVYCLHRFTHHSQPAVHQRVRGEEKREKAFTKCTTASQSKH